MQMLDLPFAIVDGEAEGKLTRLYPMHCRPATPEEVELFHPGISKLYPPSKFAELSLPNDAFIQWANTAGVRFGVVMPREFGCNIMLLDEASFALYKLTYR